MNRKLAFPRSARALAALAALTSGCAGTLPIPEFEAFDPRSAPAGAQYPDMPAVVLLDRGELSLTVDTKTGNPLARLRRRTRVKILTEAGLDRAQIVVPYEPGAAVHGLRARSISPEGRRVEADPSNIADTPYEGEVHGAVRAKTLFVPEVGVGTVVDYVYDVYVSDPRFVAPWVFQSALPTVRSELQVVVPDGYTVDLRFSENGRFVDRPPERFDTPAGTRFSWSRANLPPLYPEPNRPDPSLLAPRAHVVYLKAKIGRRTFEGLQTWDDVARWTIARRPNWAELSAENRAEAVRVAGDVSDIEKALKIMEVMARDLPPEAGPPPPLWRANLPHPNAVLSIGRANPTSRGLLFVSLLRAAGVDAVPGLFVYRDEDVILPDLPTVRALDGICAVLPRPEGPIVLDPSQPLVSATVPAMRLQGTRLVALMTDGAQVLRVPFGAPEDSLSEIRYDLRLDERGDVFGPLKATLTGAEAGALRTILGRVSPEAYAAEVSAFLRARGVPFDLQSVSLADLSALRRPLGISARITKQGFLPKEGSDIPVPIGQLVGESPDAPPEVRRSPLELGVPRKVEVRATLTVPETYGFEGVPEPARIEGAHANIDLVVRGETRRRLGVVRTEVRTAASVPPKGYRAYRRFVEARQVAEDQTILVRRPPPSSFEY